MPAEATTPAEPTTRPASPDDRAAQAALYDRCFEKRDGQTVVPWRYDRNPHGTAITRVAELQGELVSHYACNPRVVLHHGEVGSVVGQTGDVMTDPARRKLGIFSTLDREAMADAAAAGWPVVFGLPNRQSAHIFTRDLGWRAVGSIRPWTFVLVADERARAERMKAGRLAAATVPWAAWRGIMRLGKLRKLSFGKVNVVAVPRFEPEVDDLVQEVARDHPWMVRRDHAYLNWRFLEAPSGRFRAQGAFEPDGRMAGYCILQLPERGEPVGYLVDVVGRDEVAEAACIEAALGHLKKAGAAVVRSHAVEGSRWERRLRWSGFRPPKKDDRKTLIVHVHDESHPLARAALDPASWFFTDGDRDDELVR